MGVRRLWRKLTVVETDITHRFADGELEPILDDFAHKLVETFHSINPFLGHPYPTRIVDADGRQYLRTEASKRFAVLFLIILPPFFGLFGASMFFPLLVPEWGQRPLTLMDVWGPIAVFISMYLWTMFTCTGNLRGQHSKVKKYIVKRMNPQSHGVIPGSHKRL